MRETCVECGGIAPPFCLLCGSAKIIRKSIRTDCLKCGEHTFCPCISGYFLNDEEELDPLDFEDDDEEVGLGDSHSSKTEDGDEVKVYFDVDIYVERKPRKRRR